jgi:hypothetical protein
MITGEPVHFDPLSILGPSCGAPKTEWANGLPQYVTCETCKQIIARVGAAMGLPETVAPGDLASCEMYAAGIAVGYLPDRT